MGQGDRKEKEGMGRGAHSLVRVTPVLLRRRAGPMKGKLGMRMLLANGAENEQIATTTTMATFCLGVYSRGF